MQVRILSHSLRIRGFSVLVGDYGLVQSAQEIWRTRCHKQDLTCNWSGIRWNALNWSFWAGWIDGKCAMQYVIHGTPGCWVRLEQKWRCIWFIFGSKVDLMIYLMYTYTCVSHLLSMITHEGIANRLFRGILAAPPRSLGPFWISNLHQWISELLTMWRWFSATLLFGKYQEAFFNNQYRILQTDAHSMHLDCRHQQFFKKILLGIWNLWRSTFIQLRTAMEWIDVNYLSHSLL